MGRKQITQALRDEAVRMVIEDGVPAPQVGRMLGIGATAIRRWVSERRASGTTAPANATPAEDRQRVLDLEAEVRQLREERDLLKKSIVFFVRESDRPPR